MERSSGTILHHVAQRLPKYHEGHCLLLLSAVPYFTYFDEGVELTPSKGQNITQAINFGNVVQSDVNIINYIILVYRKTLSNPKEIC